MRGRFRLAMSADFLGAFARLPRAQQRGVRALVDKFNRDPTAPGLNYERIAKARSPRMRSVRIDRGYRAIVFDTGQGGLHLLLWAAKHDDAYDWAMRHDCGVNPETGALQVYVPQPGVGASGLPSVSGTPDGPAGSTRDGSAGDAAFEALRDRQLLRLGVPATMLDEIRALRGERDLDEMQRRLPVEAYESLFLYLAGESYDKLVLEREAPTEPVDTDDFETALGRADSRVRFFVADDEAALEEVLSAPLERWRVFLHPSQRKLVERHWNGPVRVLGGAGTGKTVVAMHRARWLARRALAEAAGDSKEAAGDMKAERGRILFATYTRNLAADIENNLRAICSPEEMEQIEVVNLDRWVNGFLRGQGYEFRIGYGYDRESWDRAMDLRDPSLTLPDAFYEEELEQVVLAGGVTTEDEYLRVPRVGRGTPLNRRARAKVWPVFAEYRVQLAERGIKAVDDAYRDAAALLRADRSGLNYVAVVVDEAQDWGAQACKLIRAIVPEGRDDLFVVGDGHQRIYGVNRVVLGRCGINIRGRSKKLRVCYRTTEETRDWAARLLEDRTIDDLDGGSDDNRGFKSLTHGPRPRLAHFDSEDEQADYIAEYLQEVSGASGEVSGAGGATGGDEPEGGHDPLRNVCVVVRINRERKALADALEERGIPVFVLDRKQADQEHDHCVRVATMHRVKGLEFDRVVVASANRNLVPLPAAVKNRGDDASQEMAETGERALLYVAATRAKKELLVLSYGRRSRFLPDVLPEATLAS